jgi:hypothetical protein
MARLLPLGLSQLTGLERLKLDVTHDFTAPRVRRDGQYFCPDSMQLARRDWRLAAQQLFAPLAASLRHLSIEVIPERDFIPVSLPAALSQLTRCTALLVHCGCLASVGPGLRQMRALKRLELVVGWSRSTKPESRLPLPALRARDLAPLSQLEHLHLTYARPHLARVIATGLPALKALVLYRRDICAEDALSYGLAAGRQLVLRATRFRAQRTGLRLFVAPPMYRISEPEMGDHLEDGDGERTEGDDPSLWDARGWPLAEESDDTDDGGVVGGGAADSDASYDSSWSERSDDSDTEDSDEDEDEDDDDSEET